MSRIDELIAEHCPDGVEFKQLGECIEHNLGGGTPSRSRSDYWGGAISWASVGDITATSLTIETTRQTITDVGLKNSSSNLIPQGWVIVAVKIAPGKMRVVEHELAINQDIRGLKLIQEIDPYFLAYYFQTINIVGNGTIVKGITNQVLLRTKIPVPPLAVQRAIVEILDTFSQLEAELEAELEARRQQYEYYREQLLKSSEMSEFKLLGNLVKIKNGKDHKHLAEGEIPVYGSGGIMRYVDTASTQGPSVLIPRKGSLGNLFYVENPFWHVDTIFSTEIDSSMIEPKFLFHQLSIMRLGEMNQAGGVPSQTQSVLNRLRIPVPPLAVQRRIVAILDKFDALVNDLSIGLPAELKARRQQYEYYRDKLLTFKELEAAA